MAELFKVNAPVRKPLFEGVQGENEARSIQFDIEPWVTELGDGVVTATAKRSQDSQPYPVTVTKDGNIVTWKPTSTDTAYAGVGSFQLEYTVDSVLAKTCIWSTMVAPSLDPAGDPPDPYDNWLAEMRQIAADALQDAQDADASAQDAEAWAVGQRGGVDVPSTDPAYENNAKYWAGQAEDLKDATQAIVDEARADVFEAMDGLHEETTAGSALQLISDKHTENKEPYLFRKSIAGDRELDTLVGGSVAWNQLVYNGNFESASGWAASGSLSVANNKATVSQETANYINFASNNQSGIYMTPNHKYLVSAYVASSSGIAMFLPDGFTAGGYKRLTGLTSETKCEFILNALSSLRFISAIRFPVTTSGTTETVTATVRNYCYFDLTAMFGTAVADRLYALEQANAGSGVALFRSWFPKDYYAYNEGTLMSVKTSAHEMVGFNQWDEEIVTGYFDSVGTWNTSTANLSSKNPIPVLPSTTYYFETGGATGYLTYWKKAVPSGVTDAANFISRSGSITGNTFTTPSDCYAVHFNMSSAYGTTYKNDICVNLSWSGWRNGEYEPYVKHTYPLDPDLELRGIPKLVDGEIQYDGDTYEADGTVTRKYGIVDLGALSWTKYDVTQGTLFRANVLNPNIKRVVFTTTVPNIFCPKYQTVASASRADKTISMSNNYDAVDIIDNSYADATAFKTAMNGVYLVYELATPTTETADPYTSPQIVDAYGTERYVDERTVAVPVGHVTKYPDNLREKLDGLPWDFSTLIAPTEKAYTATRNYTTGSLFIVGNILYKATANIANGGTITPNTNCTATTLAEVISAL